jgi:hypothetical protein
MRSKALILLALERLRRTSAVFLLLFLIEDGVTAISVRADSPVDAGQGQPDALKPLPEVEGNLPWRSMVDDPLGLEPSDEDLGKSLLKEIEKNAEKQQGAGDSRQFGPTPPPYRAQAGEVVTAVAAVREQEHKTAVDIVHGLAVVTTTMRFVSSSEKPAEVRYRLAVPTDAGLQSLTVCNSNGCRTGLVDRPNELSLYDDALLSRGPKPILPIARAAHQQDARGHAIALLAAPVYKGSDLTVTIGYVARADRHNGITRFQLPALGTDPRAAQTTLEVAPSLINTLVTEPPRVQDPWIPIDIIARIPMSAKQIREVWHFNCDKEQCARVWIAAAAEPLEPVDLTLFIDASPSMIGPARGRVASAVSVLLAAAPQGTRVRAVVFAARAKALIEKPVDAQEAPLALIANSVVEYESQLGSATRFESAWEMVKPWFQRERHGKNRQLIVIVGDGGLTSGSRTKPFLEAKRAGIEVSVLNLANRDVVSALREGVMSTGGGIINAAAQAEQASRGVGTSFLEDRISAFFAKVAEKNLRLRLGKKTIDLGSLRTGEDVVWEGVVETKTVRLMPEQKRATVTEPLPGVVSALEVSLLRAAQMKSPREVLAAVDPDDFKPGQSKRPALVSETGSCDPRGPAWRKSGISSDEAPISLAEQRACDQPYEIPDVGKKAFEPGKGMPSGPLLTMLRNRIVPVARGCFRRDRAGRPDYKKRALFVFQLAEREVVSASVEGEIPPKLRDCLLSAVDTLEVPRFSGNVIVRYPLITESEPLPHQIELTPEVAEQVDSILK